MKKENQKIKDALFFSLVFLFICWALFLTEEYLGFKIKQYGMAPGKLEGLRGIITMHFLHGGWKHILGNSLSFFTLTTMMFYFYRKIAFKVFMYIAIFGGILLWLIAGLEYWIGGNSGNHIGASLIIFGVAFFLFFAGLFSKNQKLLRIGLVVAFFYGSMVWSLLPIDPNISWEGHLSGALVGVFLAWKYKDQTPKRSKTRWEIEEELEKEYKDLQDNQIIIRKATEYISVDEINTLPISIQKKFHNLRIKETIIEIPVMKRNFVIQKEEQIEVIQQPPNIVYHFKRKKNE